MLDNIILVVDHQLLMESGPIKRMATIIMLDNIFADIDVIMLGHQLIIESVPVKQIAGRVLRQPTKVPPVKPLLPIYSPLTYRVRGINKRSYGRKSISSLHKHSRR